MGNYDPEELRERVVEELCSVGFADISDFMEIVTENGEPRLKVRDTATIPRERRAAIVSIKMGTRGIEIKLADKLGALEKLGRFTGIFDSAEENGDIGALQSDIFGTEDDEPDEDA